MRWLNRPRLFNLKRNWEGNETYKILKVWQSSLPLDALLDQLCFTFRTLYVLFDTDADVVCLLPQFGSSSSTEGGWCLTWQFGTSDLEASDIQHWGLYLWSKWQEISDFTLYLTFLGDISGQYLACALVWWLWNRAVKKHTPSSLSNHFRAHHKD